MDGIVMTISCKKYYVCKWLCHSNLKKLQLYVAYLATLSHLRGIHQDTGNIAVPCYLQPYLLHERIDFERFLNIGKNID